MVAIAATRATEYSSKVVSVTVFSAVKYALNHDVVTLRDELADLALEQKNNKSVEHIYLLVGIFFITTYVEYLHLCKGLKKPARCGRN